MSWEKTYNITDTSNDLVAIDSLKQEIEESVSIEKQINLVSASDTVITLQFSVEISASELTALNAIITAHEGVPLEEPLIEQPVKVNTAPPFAAKKIVVNGVEKSLFKRVHGANATITANSTADIDFVVPYAHAKFTGANIFGNTLGDTLDFTVHDDASNTYSGAPGSNYKLNQFGYDVEMPGEPYENTSDYDADLYYGMVIRCSYTNNTNASAYIAMNVWLHEVKD